VEASVGNCTIRLAQNLLQDESSLREGLAQLLSKVAEEEGDSAVIWRVRFEATNTEEDISEDLMDEVVTDDKAMSRNGRRRKGSRGSPNSKGSVEGSSSSGDDNREEKSTKRDVTNEFEETEEAKAAGSDDASSVSEKRTAAAAAREERSKRRQAHTSPIGKKKKKKKTNPFRDNAVRVPMLTGTLYLYQGPIRRAEFVRKV